MSSELSLAPFRSFEDFLFSKARFRKPSFGDIDKWSNRVVANLMFYQTNYLVLAGIVLINFGIMSPKKMLLGLTILAILALAYYLTTKKPLSRQTSKNSSPKSMSDYKSQSQVDETLHYLNYYRPYISIVLVIIGVYLIIYRFSSVAMLLLSALVSIAIILVHASTRKRSFKNKINNKIETVGLKRTPMGILLQLINIQSDDFLN